MADLNRTDLELRYELFDRFATKDQDAYYRNSVLKHEKAARRLRRARAVLALATGSAAALAAALAQSECGQNGTCSRGISVLLVLSVILPALGGFVTSLADLFQWERLIQIYSLARENLKSSDALSPSHDDTNEDFINSLYAYVEGTLQVMSDETAQWGKAIREPKATKEAIEAAQARINDLLKDEEPEEEEPSPPPAEEE